jgi:hypothetical protein
MFPSYFTRHRALEHRLTGWVRNTDNNKVSFTELHLNLDSQVDNDNPDST